MNQWRFRGTSCQGFVVVFFQTIPPSQQFTSAVYGQNPNLFSTQEMGIFFSEVCLGGKTKQWPKTLQECGDGERWIFRGPEVGIDLKFTDFETAGLLQIKNLEKRTCPAGNSNQKNCWEIHKWILKFTVHGCSSRGALELRAVIIFVMSTPTLPGRKASPRWGPGNSVWVGVVERQGPRAPRKGFYKYMGFTWGL